MKNRDLMEALAKLPEDAEVQAVLVVNEDSGDDDLESGAVLDIVETGVTRGMHVIYVRPAS